ncbi:fecR family protein [Asticcacaulis biprosthecium C19]|uniref:FecR family protein n=1 Tax=Asticcacaulis biprosthecium C19 TaxID=715226 RepID=F4QN77_9CAUL|nr:FecR family protein [Asticcacaulis biprosthecium]EGF91668.1 fecR family protein [Asticcacaulis biprosthecium C19]
MVRLRTAEREQADAEASAWLARLQHDDRSTDTEAAFQNWLNTHPDHQAAFERATEVWELLPGAASVRQAIAANDDFPIRAKPARKAGGRRAFAAVAAASVAAMVAAGALWMSQPTVYETLPGEQQVTTLRDGSRVSLNTDSRVTVAYGPGQRQVALDRGEALFDVKPDPKRPFVVTVGDGQVKALGTSFLVRRNPDHTAVTLIHGKVEVSRRDGDGLQRLAILLPGERLTFGGPSRPVLDKPVVDTVTAWRHGEVIFSDISLREAAGELNRYGPVRIIIADPEVGALRVSGVFETNDAAEFAVAVAQMNRLKARRSGETIVLSR